MPKLSDGASMGLVPGRLFAFLLLTVIVLTSFARLSAAADGDAAVLGVRVASHDAITRFVVDLTEKVDFSVGRTDGDIVVDLPDLAWRAKETSLWRPVGLLRNFSFSKPRAGVSRLILKPAPGATVGKAFLIPPGESGNYRLVVDLIAAAPEIPRASAPMPQPQPQPLPKQAMSAPPVTSPAKASEPKAVPKGKPVVVLDPGHGGVDPGATSLSGVFEKTIVLSLAKDIKAILDKGGKVKCVLTRDRDIFIPLRERVAIARAAKADLFMSLHADTVEDPSIRGLSVYTLSRNASDAEAQALADKENKADIVAGIDLSNEPPEVTNILIDLVQRESMNLSARFAGRVIREVEHDTHNVLESNTHRFAGFAVLKAPDVPSVLVETGYLSNNTDEQMLRRPEYRNKLAVALARAIESYFSELRVGRR